LRSFKPANLRRNRSSVSGWNLLTDHLAIFDLQGKHQELMNWHGQTG